MSGLTSLPCPACSQAWPNGTEKNGTLKYMLTDPRTEKEFAQCWDKAKNNWTVLPDVKVQRLINHYAVDLDHMTLRSHWQCCSCKPIHAAIGLVQ